ncbi:MAG: hypothetical protein CMK59_10915 [Proteobacteria bacterium]|nr:hypothetical protein [Pseudomonadota bacterium]
MNIFLYVLTTFGLCAVGLCFIVFFPLIPNLLLGLFGAVVNDQLLSKVKNKRAESDFIDPKALNGQQSIE